MSPTLNGSSTLERFKCSTAIEIHNGIMFNFYPGLPHMYILIPILLVHGTEKLRYKTKTHQLSKL